ncbi:hypothetical protein GE300_08400 [Rhodobacteraceae bacterium 2CG4]|uniref:Uncharacterized protein n=1 Tax=Halovulum marinum TaxID=2662447 RepID=A0A6L5YZC8_9RHOB|nr:hypothetical protein [Halovulum marinum]
MPPACAAPGRCWPPPSRCRCSRATASTFPRYPRRKRPPPAAARPGAAGAAAQTSRITSLSIDSQ